MVLRARAWIMPLLLAAITVAPFSNGIHAPFVFDDIPELVQSPDIRTLSACLNTISHSSDTGLAGRPVACFSFALNYAIGGLDVRGFHALNIFIHVLAALTLFGVLRKTIGRTQGTFRASPDSLAFGISALWAVHPLHTESVTYVIQRIESLAGLWYLLTLYCAIRAFDSKRIAFWTLCAITCCAMGMFTKEILVTAPLVVFLYDACCRSTSFRSALRRNRWLHAGLAATWLIPIVLLSQSPRGSTVGLDLGVSPLDYLRTQAGVIVHYMRLCFYPRPLAISYSDWPIVREWRNALLPGTFIVLLLAISTMGVIKRKLWGFAGAWFFVILAPTSSFIPIVTEPAAERRMYLPLIAVVGLAVVLTEYGLNKYLERMRVGPGMHRALRVVICFILIGALGAETVARNADYASAERLLAKTLVARPGDELVRGALIQEFIDHGKIEDARRAQKEGLAKRPNSPVLHENWGRAMARAGHYDEAISSLETAIALQPGTCTARNELGLVLAAQGRWSQAAEVLRRAVDLCPDSYRIHGNLGVALANLGEVSAAMEEWDIALRMNPGYADGHYNLGRTLEEGGDVERALEHLRQAARFEPGDLDIAMTLGSALERSGKTAEAIGEYRRILTWHRSNAEVTGRLRELESDATGN